MEVGFFTNLAYAAIALLVASLAVYISVRLLGKLAKFLIFILVAVVVVRFVISDNSAIQNAVQFVQRAGDSIKGVVETFSIGD